MDRFLSRQYGSTYLNSDIYRYLLFAIIHQGPYSNRNNIIIFIYYSSNNIFDLLRHRLQIQNQQINTTVDVQPDMIIDNYYSVQITRILGILLDNAIEASLESNHPQISFITKNDQIIIQNTTSAKKINLKRIYNNGYSTKDSHSGLGLATVQKIVTKNPNFKLQTIWNNNHFTVKLLLNTKTEPA